MKDGPVRKTLKRIGLGVFNVRLFLHRTQADVRYELGGECGRCAACCEAPGIQVSRLTWYFPFASRIFLWWHTTVNQFELVEATRSDRVFIFSCTHFDKDTKSCDSYDSRPGMCRDYPRLITEHANPEFLEGCGFKAIAKNRAELVQILDNQSLTPEQMTKLRKGLYLDE